MTRDIYGTSGDRQRDQSTGTMAREQGEKVAHDAKQQASAVASTARDEASNVSAEAKTHARDLMHQAKGELQQQARQQTENVGGALQHLGARFEALADGRPEEAGPVGDYAQRMARSVQQMGDRVSELGFDGTVDELERFARRRPGAFLMGAAVAGFAASRLARGARDAADSDGSMRSRSMDTNSLRDGSMSSGSGGSMQAAPSSPASVESSFPPPPPTMEEVRTPIPPAPDQAAPSVQRYGTPGDTDPTMPGGMQR